jgi:hypothetical protein
MALLRKLIIGHFQKKRYINSDENNTQIKVAFRMGRIISSHLSIKKPELSFTA